MTPKELNQILSDHKKWLYNDGGKRANLTGVNLTGAYLTGADLSGAYLTGVNLTGAYLTGADLSRAYLSRADLTWANLSGANLSGANLSGAYLTGADLSGAYLTGVNLTGAYLFGADLTDVKGLVKIMGVEPGNYYWKKIGEGLLNEGYQFRVGLNKLQPGEIFADDERILCSYPGFHFASKSWCEVNYSERPYLAKIRIPEDAKINEPWATDGKASADMIEIKQVFDKEGNDVTDKFRNQ